MSWKRKERSPLCQPPSDGDGLGDGSAPPRSDPSKDLTIPTMMHARQQIDTIRSGRIELTETPRQLWPPKSCDSSCKGLEWCL
jgi:hypothetical protein